MSSMLVARIVCPHCHAELEVHHDTCPHCRTPLRVSTANSVGGANDDEPLRVLDRPWVLAVLLLHVGFLGIPLYWRTRYAVGTRVTICLLSVAYTLFAVGFIVVVGSWLYRVFTGG